MPNRILREGILTSDRIDRLSYECEIFYRRLMSVVDDFGRYTADVRLLRAALYPLRLEKVREASVERFLVECEEARLVRLYIHEKKRYLLMLDFKQNKRALISKYPEPPEMRSTCVADELHLHPYAESEAKTEKSFSSVGQADSNLPHPEFSASNGKPASKQRIYLADAEFVMALKLNPAYAGIDVDLQIHKARAWLMTPRAKGKQLTRQFLVNWLNRCDSVIGVVQPQKKEKVMTQEEKDKYFKLNELIKSFPQSIPEIKQLTGADFGFVFGGLNVDQKNELNGLKKEKV